MYYYTIYDLSDNLVAFINDISELCSFTKLPLKEINRKFKGKKYMVFEMDHRKYKATRWS